MSFMMCAYPAQAVGGGAIQIEITNRLAVRRADARTVAEASRHLDAFEAETKAAHPGRGLSIAAYWERGTGRKPAGWDAARNVRERFHFPQAPAA